MKWIRFCPLDSFNYSFLGNPSIGPMIGSADPLTVPGLVYDRRHVTLFGDLTWRSIILHKISLWAMFLGPKHFSIISHKINQLYLFA